MYKRALSLFICIIMLTSTLAGTGLTVTAATYSGTCGDNLTWSLDTSTGVLNITGTGDMYDYSNENYSTTAPWKSYISYIKSVVIGDSVTSIGDWAISYCTYLTSVTIGDSVTSIGYEAFHNGTSITSLIIGDSVTDIGKCAFYNCSKLKSVTIPDSVISIGDNAFNSCSSLTNVTIGNSVTSIGKEAFCYCFKLTSVTIGNSVTSIGRYAFYDCPVTIKCYENSYAHTYAVDNGFAYELIIPAVVAGTCGDNLTWNLDTATGVLEIEGTGDITDYEYKNIKPHTTAPWGSYYSYIKSVVISDSVTSIGSYAFYYCTSLTSVTIPNSVTSIGSYAFLSCESLTSVTIPDSVTSIGSYAFYECSNLTSVTIPDSVTSVGDNAFAYCSKLTSVTIGNSVTSIGSYAFYYCDSLTSVTISDSVTSIGSYAFFSCDSLTSVTIPNSVTSIGEWAFFSCESLTSVTIGNSVTSIGSSAFNSCTSLTSVTIPDSVTSIGNGTFSDCTSLTSVTIPDSVTSIGEHAFYNCTSLTSVTIPDSVTSIGYRAFHYYSNGSYYKLDLTIKCYENSYAHTYAVDNGFDYELIIPDLVSGTCGDNLTWSLDTTIGVLTIDGTGDMYDYYTDDSYNSTAPWYNYISYIKQIVIGDSVTSIGASAFCRCDELTSVNIPDSITSIGSNAFVACYSLSKITIPATVTYMGSYVFTEVYLHADYIYFPLDIIIECYENSCAHEYAETYGLPYRVLDIIFGTCGDNLNWTINTTTGTLTISGTGDMYDYYVNGKYRPDTTAPWNNYYDMIKSIVICDGVTSIGNAAFSGCRFVTSCTISDTVTDIGNIAFYYCDSLTDIVIPDTTVSIGEVAFANCTLLETINIPASVVSIGNKAFADCNSITNIEVDIDNQYYTSLDGVLYNKEMTELIRHPVANQRSEFTIPDTVTTIADYAFQNCHSLTSVTIPKSVTSIGANAFHYYDLGYKPLELTVYCYENSYAYTYAVENGFAYELLCKHSFTDYTSDSNATCTEDGTKTAYCDNGCGMTDTVVDEGTAFGHTWSEWIVSVAPTYTTEGKQIRFCYVCDTGETEIIPVLSDPNKPVITVDNFKVTITNAELIKDMRYALGEYTTTTEIKAAEGNVAISNTLVQKYTVDGSFIYEMPTAGYFTIWIRMKDGTNYILPLDVTKVTPSVTTYGVKITLHNLFNVKDFYIAKGEFNTYREIKDNGYIVSVTGAKIGTKHDYTYTVYEPGIHTILVRYNDGTQAIFHETLVVDEPVFTTNGLQVTISNLPDVKVIRTAYGEWNTVRELKATDTLRNFAAKSAINGKDPYTIQYREDGVVTVIVEYNNGYQKLFHYTVQHKQSSCTVTGDTVLLRNLDGMVMIRYAPGEYSTSAEIKRAPGAKYLKPADLTGEYAIVSGLAKGTYTFCVQFDDESYNYFTVTVN